MAGEERHFYPDTRRRVLKGTLPDITVRGMTYAPPASHRTAPVYHGGDLGWADARYADAPRPWLDLSTGINPWPYPLAPPPTELWARLPSAALGERLRQAAALAYGAIDPAAIVSAPGSQALIQWLPRLRSRSSVAVLGPTYGEHAAAWTAAGHVVQIVSDINAAPNTCAVVVLGNPNNPDGRVIARDRLSPLADKLAERGGWLVIDEAFADVAPEASLAAEAHRPGRIVLRSFGKFFGLAGLRLGFALAEPSVAAALTAALGPWAVSGPAAWIGATALADRAWIAATRSRLAAATRMLDVVFEKHRVQIVGGTDLFRLIAAADAEPLFDSLCRHGIFARRFPQAPTWLRFGLPADDTAMARLDRALAEWRRKVPA
jgi:cobalamin biosynthetic protein CobC